MKNKIYFFLKFLPVMMTTGLKPTLHLKIPLFAVLLLLSLQALSQLPHLIEGNFRLSPGLSSFPAYFINVNGTLFFSADDGINGTELWKSDGTIARTVLVKDIYPGISFGKPAGSNPSNLTNVNGTLFFIATNGVNGYELWKSDGTTAGTVLVSDIVSGTGNSNPSNLTNVNGTLFFTATTAANGQELWKSDGTAAGTVLVRDIVSGTAGSFPNNLTNVNGTLFFSAFDTTNGSELWKSDGTVAGTVLVRDIVSGTGNSNPSNLTNVNGTLFFTATTAANGQELWKSDGTTAGTVLVSDIVSGTGNSNPSNLTNVNGTLFFTATTAANGQELWKSDGTAAGTVLVRDIVSGTAGSFPNNLTNVNGTLFFSAFDTTNSSELWKSDGTVAGTVLVKDIYPGILFGQPAGSNPSNLTNVNGTLFFSADDDMNGAELWKSNGTAAGTVLVRDIVSGTSGSAPLGLVNVNGILFFTAYDIINGRELWVSDGTTTGTVIREINKGTASSKASELTSANGTLFFAAADGVSTGKELWKSDGTAAGTVLVKDIKGGSGSISDFSPSLTNVNGTLFFAADNGINGTELWKSDGTVAGTVMVRDIVSGSAGALPSNLTNVNGTLFFRAFTYDNGYELWKSDGTAAGTVLVKDIRSGTSGSDPDNLTNVNGILFFRANDGINGQELWKSDGTAAGTVLVRDIRSGSASSLTFFSNNLTNINGTLFFKANDGVNGDELWKSDGTTAGTVLVRDIDPGFSLGIPISSNPNHLTNVNGTLFFSAFDTTNGTKLWKSDGTVAGTVLVSGLGGPSPYGNLTNVNGTLFFSATNAVSVFDTELWKSDGTAAGTVLVRDINSGTGSGSFPDNLTNINGTLSFTVDNGVNGKELWKSDGTTAGTVLVKDIFSGTSGSNPINLTNVNGTLFFGAQSDFDGFSYGYSLWKLGTCNTSNTLVSTPAFPSQNRSRTYNSQQQTSPITQSCHCDIYNNLVTTIDATGASPVSGSIDSKVWIDAAQTAAAVLRHYEINPATNPTTATGRVTLYFTQAEFDGYNALNTFDLPTNDTDALGKANLRIKKYDGTSANGTGAESSYGGTATLIDPIDSDIVWNATLSRWEVSFAAVGFGGYFAVTNTNPCPPSITPTGTITTNQKAATAIITVNGSPNTIPNAANVVYQGGNFVQLNPGFNTANGAVFTARILAGCQ